MDICSICEKETKNFNHDLFEEELVPVLCAQCYAQGKMLQQMFGTLDWEAFRMMQKRQTEGSKRYE